MADTQLLDNPIWNALNTDHRHLSIGDTLARSYLGEVGPLSATANQSPQAYESLRALAGSSGVLALFLEQPPIPQSGWSLVRDGQLSQMIYLATDPPVSGLFSPAVELRALTSSDVPSMIDLAKLTEPGPFRRRTCELGVFFGIFAAGRLLAMAGQRMHIPGFVEVSAVCSHPDARGRGYARAVISAVIANILERGKTPILHVFSDNHPAIRVYQGLGFSERRVLHLAVLKNDR